MSGNLEIKYKGTELTLFFRGEFSLYNISHFETQLKTLNKPSLTHVDIDLNALTYLDTSASLFLNSFTKKLNKNNISYTLICGSKELLDTLNLTDKYSNKNNNVIPSKTSFIESIGKKSYDNF
ncbi:MAG: STAS domain-containing protein, partial [Thiovulaceae bacterium]|nr:STAS domain-containing protein [Sulfurimonadaceae bacterium]